MTDAHANSRLAALVLAAICVSVSPGALAQTEPELAPAIDWSFASYFGTGHYEIGGVEDVYALRLGLRKEIRPAELREDGRTIGITLRAPITIGLHNFDRSSILDLTFDDVGTLSAVPGVEFEIPFSERWSIKPLAYLGWGSELDGDSSAFIYWTGLKSQRSFHADEFDWALVSSITYVGHSPSSGASTHIVPAMVGFDFSRPLENRHIGGERVMLHWHVAYTSYLNDLAFDDGAGGTTRVEVGGEWEAGVAFGKEGSKLKVWKLRWDRVGIAFRHASDLRGFRIVFRSLFHR
jgi:hypothetical protein